MTRWTDSQQAAISARNPHILVSAAAGSGKTSVLIERIMSLLREGGRIDRMLVVTFTHAAAAEMRMRLSRALTAEAQHDRHLLRQLRLLSRAHIGTLHSICGKIITQHFQAAGVDPVARVGDEGRLAALFDRALEEEMERMYAQPDADQQQLIDRFSDQQLEAMLRQLYYFLMAQDEPWQWLERFALPEEGDLTRHPWYQSLLHEARADIDAAIALIDDNIRLCQRPDGPGRYLNNCNTDRALAEGLMEALTAPGSLAAAPQIAFGSLSRAKATDSEDPALRELVKEQRDQVKNLLKTAVARLPLGEEATEQAARDLKDTAPSARALGALTRAVDEAYTALKESRQLLDYNDLEHRALQCLTDEAVRGDVAGQYDALFVDEYQDISRIQEAIIRRLQREGASLFMVGDVKQSIYRFRLADPDLFLEKQSSFDKEAEAEARLIHLSHNFRSRGQILSAVNHVFVETMQGGALEIDYDADVALYPGRQSKNDPPTELHLVLPADDADAPEWLPDDEEPIDPGDELEDDEIALHALEREALLIAERIKVLLDTPMGEGERRFRYRDMVILLRSASGRAMKMAEIFKRCGIPVYSDADQQYFDLQEVEDTLALLSVIDNPCQDVPLLSVLSGPAFDLTALDIARLRTQASDDQQPLYESFFALAKKEEPFKRISERISRWRFLCQHTPLDSFLRRLIRETGIYARAGAKPQGQLRRANLRLLCERAQPNPEPQTLQGFLSRVHEARRQDSTRAAAPLGMAEDVVRIMTIHKSKGLEFPVVFLPDLARRFRFDGQNDLLLLHKSLGMGLRKIDPLLRMSHATLAGKAIQLKKEQEVRSEEARLLYVAMTRARDRLILIGSVKKLENAQRFWRRPSGRRRSADAGSMLDWVGASLWPGLETGLPAYTAPNGSQWQISYHSGDALRLPAEPSSPGHINEPRTAPGEAISRQMAGLAPLPAHPLKLSVTQLVKRAQEEMEETAATKRVPMDRQAQPPRDGAGSGVSRGAATHRAMSALSLDSLAAVSPEDLPAALNIEMDRLLGAGILSAQEAERAMRRRMADFYRSDLGLRLLRAKDRQREWAFSLMVEDGVLLQGVLDCCFMEAGGWVLLDYKTDRAQPEEILRLYRDQMRWYMRALRDITNRPVKAAYLYALQHGEAIPVTEDAPIRYQGELFTDGIA